jgi:cell division protease FtsH
VEQERTSFLGTGFGTPKNYSEETARQIDEEIKTTMMQRLDLVTKLVRENLTLLKEVAKELLEKETLNAEDFQALIDRYRKKPQVAIA